MKKLIIPIVTLLSIVSCNENSAENSIISPADVGGAYEGYADYEANYELKTDQESPAGNGAPTATSAEKEVVNRVKRKLVKNAVLSFETDSLQLRKKIIDAATTKFDGYIANEEHYESNGRNSVDVTVRIPSNYFDDFMNMATQGVGEFESRSISVNDVTEEYVDVAARIETKKELKKRFVKLLDRATSIPKIFEIEREISALQATIESYESRLIKLGNSAAYSTIVMTYFKVIPEKIIEQNEFADAFSVGWNGLVGVGLILIRLWPFLIILTLGFFIYLNLQKKKQNKAVKR